MFNILKFLSIVIFLTNSNHILSQSLTDNSKKSYNLKGNVKERSVNNYKVIEKNGQYYKGDKIFNSNDFNKTYFNKEGMIIREELVNNNSSLELWIENIYNKNGNIIHKKSSDGKFEKFEYNDKNLISKQYYYNNKGILSEYYLYEYNNDNLLMNIYRYDKDNNLLSFINKRYDRNKNLIEIYQNEERTKFYYNENNFLIKQESYSNTKKDQIKNLIRNKGIQPKFWSEYKYDLNGNKSEVIDFEFDNNNNVNKHINTYLYDNSGNITLNTSYLEFGNTQTKSPKNISKYIYEYDDFGNWIRYIFFNNEEPKIYIESVIKYY